MLSCTDGTPVGTGSVVASQTAVKIMGTTIDIGGAITVIGGPGQPNVQLNSVLTDITEAKTGQAQLMAQ